jgi:hypothetical protein
MKPGHSVTSHFEIAGKSKGKHAQGDVYNPASTINTRECMQVYRFLVRYYGNAGEKVDAAAVAFHGGRQVLRHFLLRMACSLADD